MVKGSKAFNIVYYIGKYIFTMFLICNLLYFIYNNAYGVPLLMIFINYFVLKVLIVGTLETTEYFKMKKTDLDLPFVIYTSIALFLIGMSLYYNIFLLIFLIVVHIITFMKMDANNEKRIREANKAIDEYFLTHPKKKRGRKDARIKKY